MPRRWELGKVKTRGVLRELEGGSEPFELERKRPLDPEEPRVGLAT